MFCILNEWMPKWHKYRYDAHGRSERSRSSSSFPLLIQLLFLDYDDHVYFATTDFNNQDNRGLVYKIATGNAGGPSDTTAPSVINTLEFTAIFYGGVVRRLWQTGTGRGG